MHQIDGLNVAAAYPTPEAVGPVVGFFAAKGVLPATQLTGDFLNAVMLELKNAIEGAGLVLDKTDNTQLLQALQAALISGAVSVGAATSLHKAGVLLSEDSGAFGEYSLVAACNDVDVDGDCSVALASNMDGASAPGVVGDGCLLAACDALGGLASVAGVNCAAIASRDPVTAALFAAIIASATSEVTSTTCAVIGSQDSKVVATSGTSPQGVVLLASKNTSFAAGANGTAQRQYAVAGGYHASSPDTAPSWRVESNGGTMRSTAAHTTSGLDYAEMAENGDGFEHPPGRLLTERDGGGVVLAQEGDFTVGFVSVAPTVVGGDDGIAWAKRYVRDAFGELLTEEVEVEHALVDQEASATYQTQRASIAAAMRVAAVMPPPPAYESLPKGILKGRKRRQIREGNDALYRSHLTALQARLVAVQTLRAQLDGLTAPPPKTEKAKVRQLVLDPRWDPAKPQVSRRDRKEEWTCVGLTGQIRVAVNDTVTRAGEFVVPWKDGIGQAAAAPGPGKWARVRRLVEPYDAMKGYAVALCWVG